MRLSLIRFPQPSTKSQRGVAYVELALTLPLFFAGIFFLIWLGMIFNARSNLTNAMAVAVRLAATRGNYGPLQAGTINDLNAWRSGGGGNGNSRVCALLSSDASSAGCSQALIAYQNSLGVVFGAHGNHNLHEFPISYTYTAIYLNEAMRQTMGSGLSYPGNPASTTIRADTLTCVFLNPNTVDRRPWPANFPIPTKRVAVECRYRPHVFLVDLLIDLFSLSGGGNGGDTVVTVTERAVLNL